MTNADLGGLRPVGKNILVELTGKYQHIVAASKAYESKTHGTVRAIGASITTPEFKIGEVVYWQEYREGSTILVGDRQFAFVAVADIQGAQGVKS